MCAYVYTRPFKIMRILHWEKVAVCAHTDLNANNGDCYYQSTHPPTLIFMSLQSVVWISGFPSEQPEQL